MSKPGAATRASRTTRARPPEHPKRGELWWAALDPTRGREQAERRPALVLSADLFNGSPAGLVSVLPVTSRDRRIRSHVAIEPPEGGLRVTSFVMCEQVRTVARERLVARIGSVSARTLDAVADRVRVLLDL